jgi:hypothetical protein
MWAMRESNPSPQPVYGAGELGQTGVYGAAKSGAVCGEDDADLARILAAWPMLSADAKAAVAKIIADATSGRVGAQR